MCTLLREIIQLKTFRITFHTAKEIPITTRITQIKFDLYSVLRMDDRRLTIVDIAIQNRRDSKRRERDRFEGLGSTEEHANRCARCIQTHILAIASLDVKRVETEIRALWRGFAGSLDWNVAVDGIIYE